MFKKMRRIAFSLSTCDTSKRILKAANINDSNFEIRDIKSTSISIEELDLMKTMTGSYEALFSRRARKYKSMGLKDKSLSEKDYKELILQDYTFLKRPVIIIDKQICVGNSKKYIEALLDALK